MAIYEIELDNGEVYEIETDATGSGAQGVSDDWYKAAGAGATFLRGVSLGTSDDILAAPVAGGRALLDALQGKVEVGEVWDHAKGLYEPARQALDKMSDDYIEDRPVLGNAINIGGAVKSAAGKALYGGAQKLAGLSPVASKLLGALAGGTTLGAAYGFGESDGDLTTTEGWEQRKQDALESGLFSLGAEGVLRGSGAGLKAAAPFFKQQAQALRGGAAGVTRGMRDRFIESELGKELLTKGSSIIDKSLDVAERYGILKNAKGPEVLARHQSAIKDVGQQIGNIVSQVDELIPEKLGKLRFPETKRWIKQNLGGKSQEGMLEMLEQEAVAYNKQFYGTFGSLKKQAEKLGGQGFGLTETPHKHVPLKSAKQLYRKMRTELAKQVQGKISRLVQEGKLEEGTLKEFRKLNFDYENLKILENVFAKKASADVFEKFIHQRLIPAMRTSGGFGVPALVGSTLGTGAGALAIPVGMYATSPTGQLHAAQGLRKAAPYLEAAANAYAPMVDPMVRALAPVSGRLAQN